jgi:hypothetical protein
MYFTQWETVARMRNGQILAEATGFQQNASGEKMSELKRFKIHGQALHGGVLKRVPCQCKGMVVGV